MVYFSQLKDSNVYDSKKVKAGKLADLIFLDGTDYAEITHLVYIDENKYKEEDLEKSLQNIEDNKRGEWEKREGDVSVKESWITDKLSQIEETKKEIKKQGYFNV